MVEELSHKRKFNWWLPLVGAIAALVVLAPKLINGNDFGAFLLTGVLAGVVALVLLVIVINTLRRWTLATATMLVTFCLTCVLLFRISDAVRTRVRWSVRSASYKARVLSEPQPPTSELKHVEWDAWGGVGAGDTEVYLIFDPSNSLAGPAKLGRPGKYQGIPCEVLRVRRLESKWYTAHFYTDTAWQSGCGE